MGVVVVQWVAVRVDMGGMGAGLSPCVQFQGQGVACGFLECVGWVGVFFGVVEIVPCKAVFLSVPFGLVVP